MSTDPENLNYDCTFNIFLGRAYLPKLKTLQERQRANRWMKKIQEACSRSIEEMRARSGMAAMLAEMIKEGALTSPFDGDPPPGHVDMKNLLGDWSGKDTSWLGCLNAQSEGEDYNFLAPRPLPKVGVYCLMTVMKHAASDDEEGEDS